MFWVANLQNDDAPTILAIHHVQTEAEALTLGVKMAQEQGAKDDDATIRQELTDDGRYIPETTPSRYGDHCCDRSRRARFATASSR